MAMVVAFAQKILLFLCATLKAKGNAYLLNLNLIGWLCFHPKLTETVAECLSQMKSSFLTHRHRTLTLHDESLIFMYS